MQDQLGTTGLDDTMQIADGIASGLAAAVTELGA